MLGLNTRNKTQWVTAVGTDYSYFSHIILLQFFNFCYDHVVAKMGLLHINDDKTITELFRVPGEKKTTYNFSERRRVQYIQVKANPLQYRCRDV